MASQVSLEYLQSLYNVADGIAQLDDTGLIPESLLPATAVDNYKGEYADLAALEAAYPTAEIADYAFVTGVGYYYWSAEDSAWTLQTVTADVYLAKTAAQKLEIPFVIVP